MKKNTRKQMDMINTLSTSSINSKKKTVSKNKNQKEKEKEKESEQKILKCIYCKNYRTKSTLHFSCRHELCGICVSHLLIEDDFKSLSDKKLIKIHCPICKKSNADLIGKVETSLDILDKILAETQQIRTEKKNYMCEVHNKEAEKYCIQCKKWLCSECKTLFHDKYFKEHILVSEEPFEFKECKEHSGKLKDLLCSDCNKEVCHFCTIEGGAHSKHRVITFDEYKDNILKEKKNFKYKSFSEFEKCLNNMEKEFMQQYEDSFEQKKKIIEEITKKIQKITEDYFPKRQEKKSFIENYFKVIRWCYFNYFNDLKIKDPEKNTLKFIKEVKKEISEINYDSEFTEDLEKINKNLEIIEPKKFFKYEIKFLQHYLSCIKTISDKKKKMKKMQKVTFIVFAN